MNSWPDLLRRGVEASLQHRMSSNWTRSDGPWAGDLEGLSRRSGLCFLHTFELGYDKWIGDGVDNVFSTCANFTSNLSWRNAKTAMARFIQSQTCFDTGVEECRLVSLGNWSSITWWSGAARWADVVMRVAALLAVKWPFAVADLQQRLVSVGVKMLHMQSLAAAPQWAHGHGDLLQVVGRNVHAAFGRVEDEFGFSIKGKNKGHNALIHMVPGSGRVVGVPSEADCGPGVEAVHPLNKKLYTLSNKKGDVQDALARGLSRTEFAAGELSEALSRAADRLSAAACSAAPGGDKISSSITEDDESDEDEELAEYPVTCAYATGALMRGMHVAGPAIPLLSELLLHLLPKYCKEHFDDDVPFMHSSQAFHPLRCYLRYSLVLRRHGVVSRRLAVHPHSKLNPCLQLFRDVAGFEDMREPDPSGFCEVLLVLSYDVRDFRLARFSERALATSSAIDMVLVRMLKVASRNEAFVRCSVPGPSLDKRTRSDFNHFMLLPLAALAQPRAAFPAVSGGLDSLPEEKLTPWSCSFVNIFLLL